jgi:hypothetical protein
MMHRSALLALCAALMLWAAPADAKNIGDSLMVIQTDENGEPIVGGGGGGGGPVSVADGDDVTLGAIADGPATPGSTGTISAKLRLATTLLDAIKAAVESGATAANQATLNGYVDGLEALLTTIDTDTGAIAGGIGTSTDTGCTAGSDGSLNCKIKNLTSLVDTLNTTLSTLSAKLPSTAAMADDEANPTLSKVATYPKVWDSANSNWDRMTKADAGAGVTGSNTQRVVVASDSGVCNPKDTAQFPISVSASGNTELVALTAGQTIYICDVVLSANGTVTATLIYGTGTACGTGETSMLPQDLTAQVGYTGSFGGRLKGAAANAVCIDLSGAVAVKGVITYRKMASL